MSADARGVMPSWTIRAALAVFFGLCLISISWLVYVVSGPIEIAAGSDEQTIGSPRHDAMNRSLADVGEVATTADGQRVSTNQVVRVEARPERPVVGAGDVTDQEHSGTEVGSAAPLAVTAGAEDAADGDESANIAAASRAGAGGEDATDAPPVPGEKPAPPTPEPQPDLSEVVDAGEGEVEVGLRNKSTLSLELQLEELAVRGRDLDDQLARLENTIDNGATIEEAGAEFGEELGIPFGDDLGEFAGEQLVEAAENVKSSVEAELEQIRSRQGKIRTELSRREFGPDRPPVPGEKPAPPTPEPQPDPLFAPTPDRKPDRGRDHDVDSAVDNDAQVDDAGAQSDAQAEENDRQGREASDTGGGGDRGGDNGPDAGASDGDPAAGSASPF